MKYLDKITLKKQWKVDMSSTNVTHNSVFECTMCGKCCEGFGGTFITIDEAKKISNFLKISYDEFISKKTQFSNNKIVLGQKEDNYCIFWNKNKACLIHAVKPTMCEKWPFINAILIDFNNWKIMANSCPGIKIEAKKNKIINFVKMMRTRTKKRID